MTREEAINALIMFRELFLFDPQTGETHALEDENKNNQDLYHAVEYAIEALTPAHLTTNVFSGDFFCSNCGKYLNKNVQYCSWCGRKLQEDNNG